MRKQPHIGSTWLSATTLLGLGATLGAANVAGCGAATAIRPRTAPATDAAMQVPAFTLPSTLGGTLSFADVSQKSATALIFYRGFW